MCPESRPFLLMKQCRQITEIKVLQKNKNKIKVENATLNKTTKTVL